MDYGLDVDCNMKYLYLFDMLAILRRYGSNDKNKSLCVAV